MKQIPNIEDWKKLAREKLAPNVTYIDPKFKEVASWAEELLNAFWVEQQKDLDAFIDIIHHQLQKAREESVKALKVADNDIPPFPSAKDSESARIGFITGVAWARTRLHSELDQDNK